MKLSQSMMKELVDNNACPKAIYYRFVEGKEPPPTDAMFKGQYFEWHVIGATRGGVEPKFDQLIRGRKINEDLSGAAIVDKRPMEQVELDNLIVKAKAMLKQLGISGRSQVRIEVEDEQGHVDLIGKDFQKPKREALYDLKYTETALEDRWKGWANFEDMWGERFQAANYIRLWFKSTGEWCPFYFLVFGKSGWVRIIKIELTQDGLAQHEHTVNYSRDRLKKYIEQGWTAKPDYNKCRVCPYIGICKEAAKLPAVEIFEI